MKLLHTSDWHLGKRLQRRSRDSEFDAVLAEIVEIARRTLPDLIVHSGDLFDRYSLSPGDLMRAMTSLSALRSVAPVVVVGGNHDSPHWFDVLDHVFQNTAEPGAHPVTFVHTAADGSGGGRVLDFPTRDQSQRIRLAALPFIHPNRFMHLFPGLGTTHGAYAQGLRGLQEELITQLHEGYSPQHDVLVFATHLYLSGALLSGSERHLDVSDAYATAPDDLPRVSYCALGHIHKPQALTSSKATAHYAGSPLQFDFGECDDAKSVLLVEADPQRPTRTAPQRLTAGRLLKKFTGTLEELAFRAEEFSNTFLDVTITSQNLIPQLSQKVATAVPDADVVYLTEDCAETRITPLNVSDLPQEEPELTESFRAYLTEHGTPGRVADEVLAAFGSLLHHPGGDEPPPCPAELGLQEALAHPWTPDSTGSETA
ncbi:metallophosphoesterase family protein [Streptomyces longwoodensis]|uniref:metallophosphoesterase family protein n=1 Tax=Streptomyces longwoodensis TaxID=68231 RepID=UPI00099EB95F|nr:exonuclease SbcCD subunit D [Streptomyces longwoodensis]